MYSSAARLIQSIFLSAFLTHSASAQEVGDFSAGLGVTTMGYSLEGSYKFAPNVSARGMFGFGDVSSTIDIDGTDFDLDLELGGIGLVADYYPLGNGLRLTGGFYKSNFDFGTSVVASASNPVTVGTTTFSDGESLFTSTTFKNNITPMLSLGYNRNWGQVSFSSDIGAIVTGGYEFSATSDDIPPGELDAETAEQNADLDDLKLYPYLGLNLSFNF